jgi:hypothetical protein
MDYHKRMHKEMKSQNRAASNGSEGAAQPNNKEPQIFYKERPATVR